MASAAAIILAATELLDVNLLALHQPEHLGLHDGTVNQRRSKLQLTVLADGQHLVEHEFTAPFHRTEIDLKFLPLTDPVLPATVGNNAIVVSAPNHGVGGAGVGGIGGGSHRKILRHAETVLAPRQRRTH